MKVKIYGNAVILFDRNTTPRNPRVSSPIFWAAGRKTRLHLCRLARGRAADNLPEAGRKEDRYDIATMNESAKPTRRKRTATQSSVPPVADVAHLLGVGAMSRAVNANDNVADEKRKRIPAAIAIVRFDDFSLAPLLLPPSPLCASRRKHWGHGPPSYC